MSIIERKSTTGNIIGAMEHRCGNSLCKVTIVMGVLLISATLGIFLDKPKYSESKPSASSVNSTPTIDPQVHYVSYVSRRKEKHQGGSIEIVSLKTLEKWTLVDRYIDMIGSWSPDNKYFSAYQMKHKGVLSGSWPLIIYETSTGKVIDTHAKSLSRWLSNEYFLGLDNDGHLSKFSVKDKSFKTDIFNLPENNSNAWPPDFYMISDDGLWLLGVWQGYGQGFKEKNAAAYTYNLETKTLRKIITGEFIDRFGWIGNKVFFLKSDDSREFLYEIDPLGENRRLLASYPRKHSSITWDVESKNKLLFQLYGNVDESKTILYDFVSGESKEFANEPGFDNQYGGGLSISPDERYITYGYLNDFPDSSSTTTLFVRDLYSNKVQKLCTGCRHPVWTNIAD